MIRTKKELEFYIKADLMMRTGSFTRSLTQKIANIFAPDYIFEYIKASRKYSYYSHHPMGEKRLFSYFYAFQRRRLGVKLGFSISFDEIGYGLHIPHYGTIVVGNGNQIGNYAVLHTSTCITAGNKVIGDSFYLSSGAKVVKDITIGDNISVGANSVVNQSFPDNGMIAGSPAHWIKNSDAWYIRDGQEFSRRVMECENLRKQYMT